MFRRDPRSRSAATIDSLLGSGTRIHGDVQFGGGLHLDGVVAGNVRAAGDSGSRLVVSDSAVVEGSVVAAVVELHGTVRGDIHASGRLALGPRARVEGNVHYGAIEMAAGAHIKGKLIRLSGNGSGHE